MPLQDKKTDWLRIFRRGICRETWSWIRTHRTLFHGQTTSKVIHNSFKIGIRPCWTITTQQLEWEKHGRTQWISWMYENGIENGTSSSSGQERSGMTLQLSKKVYFLLKVTTLNFLDFRKWEYSCRVTQQPLRRYFMLEHGTAKMRCCLVMLYF